MLKLEMCFMIKQWYRQGWSISDIARHTGHDRKTVRKAVTEAPQTAPKPRPERTRKLDPYVSYLQKRMDEGVWNAHKLYTEITERGYTGSETCVRAFVHPLRQARQAQATVRFETDPGEQAQVDWGHFGTISHHGRSKPLYAFVMTLGWSRAMYVEFTTSADEASFMRCHINAFAYLGGVPRKIVHDNLKTAVLGRDGDGTIHWNPRYLDFACQYGFGPHACQPYRAQTKGKVESGVKYVRGNFWVGLSYTDLKDLNGRALAWLDGVANVRVHGTTHEVPFVRLPLEGLQPTPQRPAFDTSRISWRQSSRDCLIAYEGSYYSVPAAYVCQRLLVKETVQEEVVIHTAQGEEIARHRLATGRYQRSVQPGHYAGIQAESQRPRRAGAVQQPSSDTPESAAWSEAPTVEARPLSVYDALLEGVR